MASGTFSRCIKAYINQDKTYLPVGFLPSNYDVICGRGKDCFSHIGNRRFRVMLDLMLPTYTEAKTKPDKSAIVSTIIDRVRSLCGSNGAGFIRYDPSEKRWFEIGDDAAREKVGHTIREILVSRDPVKHARNHQKRALRRAKRNAKRKQEAETVEQQEPKQVGSVTKAKPAKSEAALETSIPSEGGMCITSDMNVDPICVGMATSTKLPDGVLPAETKTLEDCRGNLSHKRKEIRKTKKTTNGTEAESSMMDAAANAMEVAIEDFSTPLPCDDASTTKDNKVRPHEIVTLNDVDAVLAASPPELTSYSSMNWFTEKERESLLKLTSSLLERAPQSVRRDSTIGLPSALKGPMIRCDHTDMDCPATLNKATAD